MIKIKKIIIVLLGVMTLVFISYTFYHEWFLEVIKILKKPATFVTVLTTFLGILGAYFVANNQIKKTLKFSNPQYLQSFNMVRIHISNFKESAVKIESVVCTADRINTKRKISWVDYMDMQKSIINTIRLLNPDIDEEVILKDFSKIFYKINKDAPPYLYYSMNGLIFKMVYLYNALLWESRYLDLSGEKPKLISGFIGVKMQRYVLRDFINTYKKQVKELNFKN